MKIGILKETAAGETRVAFIPALVGALLRDQHDMVVGRGAGSPTGRPRSLNRSNPALP